MHIHQMFQVHTVPGEIMHFKYNIGQDQVLHIHQQVRSGVTSTTLWDQVLHVHIGPGVSWTQCTRCFIYTTPGENRSFMHIMPQVRTEASYTPGHIRCCMYIQFQVRTGASCTDIRHFKYNIRWKQILHIHHQTRSCPGYSIRLYSTGWFEIWSGYMIKGGVWWGLPPSPRSFFHLHSKWCILRHF